MKSPLRIVFLGSDPIALPLLDWVMGPGRDVAQIIAVFTQPDRPAGRGQKVQANEIKSWALAQDLPVLQPEKLTDDVRGQLGGFQADLALVMAYGHILRDDFIGTPRLGTLNLHTSLLPKYRGASPIQTAMANGERETGVTLMRIVRKLDAGPIADVQRVQIESLDTALDVEAKLAAACVPLLARTLPALADGTLPFQPQDDSAATFCRKLEKEDGTLDFTAEAGVLAARINGLFPWPATTVDVTGVPVKLGLGDVVEAGAAAPGYAPGDVIGRDEHGLLIATGKDLLRVRRLQRPGGRMLGAPEFLRGFPLLPPLRLASRPMTTLLVRR